MDIGETVRPESRAEWRAWLASERGPRREIWLLFWKKTSGRANGLTYSDAVEEALCFGWVDGFEKGMDAETYALRFTPRRPRSQWSSSNRERARRLLRDGQMTEAGRAALPSDL